MKKDEAKQLADNAIKALQEELKAGHSEKLIQYLNAMSRFHSYSWTNSLLIAMQNPEATLVAGFQRWLKQGRYVRKGEKGIGSWHRSCIASGISRGGNLPGASQTADAEANGPSWASRSSMCSMLLRPKVMNCQNLQRSEANRDNFSNLWKS